MATFTKVGEKYRAQIRRAGQPSFAKTHDTLKEAKEWAVQQEADFNAGKKIGVHGKTGITLGDAIDKYLKEKDGVSKTAQSILTNIKKRRGKILLHKLVSDDIVSYIKDKKCGPMTGAMNFSFLSSVLNMAKFGWKYYVQDILKDTAKQLQILGLTGSSRERTRRPTQQEIDKLVAFNFETDIPMADIIQFAVSTAMRQAEITRIEHTTLHLEHDRSTVVITDRKHPKKKAGNHKEVPLLAASVEIIKRQPKCEEDVRIFPYQPGTIGFHFRRACKRLEIVDLHFHDLRHEGTSRLFEMGYQIEEVAKFTGHEDWKMLKRYTHLKAKDVRRIEAKPVVPVAVAEQSIGLMPAGMDEELLKEFQQFLKMKKVMAMMKEGETA